MIGERIKRARIAEGLSLRELADKVGVSAQAISKYERGLDIPGSEVLIRLARALGVKTEYFLRPVSVSLSVPAFRKRASLPKKTEAAMWSRVQDQLERYLEVERLLAFTEGPGFRLPEGLKREVSSLKEVEDTAEKLRQAWGLGLDPIGNLVEILEDRGIRIVAVEVDQKFDACLVLANDEIPVIVVNSTYPGDRQRLSISHELGHLVLRPPDTLDGEKAAFRFAGAFLVPSQVVREELGEKRQRINLYELHLLKHKYGTSMQAWLYRATELGILPGPASERHFHEFRRKGWHTAEPGDQLPPEVSTRFNRLVMQALEEGAISETRVAELLGKPLARLGEEIAKEHNGLPLIMHN